VRTPTIGSLLNAELMRVRSRFVRWASLGLLSVIVLVAVITFNQSSGDRRTNRAGTTICPQPGRRDDLSSPVPESATSESLHRPW
jgi:hypothetical protein